tara:strand:- start:1875 stop:2897 length:1023 start_codon:yes stop_codon:yes gene_type:complete
MPNRVFWAGQGLAINTTVKALHEPAAADAVNVRGIQSVGITTTFNLEQVFQLGQLTVYEDVEDIPDIEITVERVLNDDKSLYTLTGAVSGNSLTQNQDKTFDVYFEVHNDATENIDDDGGFPAAQAHCSGLYVSSMSWTFPTDGNCTESFTFVGNGKKWQSGSTVASTYDTDGIPTVVGEAKVWRRQQVELETIPTSVNNMDSTPKVMSASVSIDLGREAINVLGKKLPYYRYVTFPVEVTCELEVLVRDAYSATDKMADGINAVPDPGAGSGSNVTAESIKIKGTGREAGGYTKEWNLGDKNKLTGVTWGGGSTGGENATVTFSYRNFNDFTYTETVVS